MLDSMIVITTTNTSVFMEIFLVGLWIYVGLGLGVEALVVSFVYLGWQFIVVIIIVVIIIVIILVKIVKIILGLYY